MLIFFIFVSTILLFMIPLCSFFFLQNCLYKIRVKISRIIGIMRKLQCTLTSSILLKIYNSLILPYFNYGLCSWGFHSDDLFALQKKAVRVVANRPYIAHTDPIFNKYTLIKIHDLYKLQHSICCIFCINLLYL